MQISPEEARFLAGSNSESGVGPTRLSSICFGDPLARRRSRKKFERLFSAQTVNREAAMIQSEDLIGSDFLR